MKRKPTIEEKAATFEEVLSRLIQYEDNKNEIFKNCLMDNIRNWYLRNHCPDKMKEYNAKMGESITPKQADAQANQAFWELLDTFVAEHIHYCVHESSD